MFEIQMVGSRQPTELHVCPPKPYDSLGTVDTTTASQPQGGVYRTVRLKRRDKSNSKVLPSHKSMTHFLPPLSSATRVAYSSDGKH